MPWPTVMAKAMRLAYSSMHLMSDPYLPAPIVQLTLPEHSCFTNKVIFIWQLFQTPTAFSSGEITAQVVKLLFASWVVTHTKGKKGKPEWLTAAPQSSMQLKVCRACHAFR